MPAIRHLIALMLVFAVALLGGCMSISYQNPGSDQKVQVNRLGSTRMEGLTIRKDADGNVVVEIHGYQSEDAGIVEAATKAAVTAAVGR